jgi:hypothetical protein
MPFTAQGESGEQLQHFRRRMGCSEGSRLQQKAEDQEASEMAARAGARTKRRSGLRRGSRRCRASSVSPAWKALSPRPAFEP